MLNPVFRATGACEHAAEENGRTKLESENGGNPEGERVLPVLVLLLGCVGMLPSAFSESLNMFYRGYSWVVAALFTVSVVWIIVLNATRLVSYDVQLGHSEHVSTATRIRSVAWVLSDVALIVLFFHARRWWQENLKRKQQEHRLRVLAVIGLVLSICQMVLIGITFGARSAMPRLLPTLGGMAVCIAIGAHGLELRAGIHALCELFAQEQVELTESIDLEGNVATGTHRHKEFVRLYIACLSQCDTFSRCWVVPFAVLTAGLTVAAFMQYIESTVTLLALLPFTFAVLLAWIPVLLMQNTADSLLRRMAPSLYGDEQMLQLCALVALRPCGITVSGVPVSSTAVFGNLVLFTVSLASSFLTP